MEKKIRTLLRSEKKEKFRERRTDDLSFRGGKGRGGAPTRQRRKSRVLSTTRQRDTRKAVVGKRRRRERLLRDKVRKG